MRGREKRALQAELDRALALHRQQQLDAAAALYRRILKAAPDHFDALQLLGAIEGQRGRHDEAIALLRKAVAHKPDSANAHNNLGSSLASLQRHAEALAAFERALALRPDSPKALRNRGNALRKLNRLPEALASLDRALELQPDYSDAMVSRAELLLSLHRHEEAAAAFRAALAGGKDLAMLHHALASLGAAPAPPQAPADYVKALFDDYATAFDAHLVEVLKYRTPQRLVEALQRSLPAGQHDVLELGCGTGLCGPLLRPLARRLVGIDLSDGMLARARAAGHYDELACAELVAWLGACETHFDVVLAADVLIYLGDLAPTFAGVARVLRPGGRFALSVERCDDAHDYRLQPSRRYAHSQRYLAGLAARHGFAVESATPAVLREDASREIDGLLLVLARE